MGKKNKLSVLSDADEALLAKGSKKQRAQAVNGKPDVTDFNNLVALFETYDRTTGGLLRRMIKQNKVERALNNRNTVEESVATAENLSFFMPKDLQEYVEKYWPTLWTNKDHLRWFLTKFPEFRR